MAKTVSSVEEIMAALPTVQAAVRKEIAGRIANGESVGGVDELLEAQLMKRKRELLAKLKPAVQARRAGSKKAKRSAA